MNPKFERPFIIGISEKMSKEMLRQLEADRLQILREMDEDRREMRRRRATDPHQCHCPNCYVIGG